MIKAIFSAFVLFGFSCGAAQCLFDTFYPAPITVTNIFCTTNWKSANCKTTARPVDRPPVKRPPVSAREVLKTNEVHFAFIESLQEHVGCGGVFRHNENIDAEMQNEYWHVCEKCGCVKRFDKIYPQGGVVFLGGANENK